MKSTAWLLGIAGLIPFVALPLFATLDQINWYVAYDGFTSYSAVILSFFGGIHWYDAISENKNNHQIYVAMLPSIIAWGALFLFTGAIALAILSVSYLAILVYDKQVLTLPREHIIWYTKLRMALTTIVVLCHWWVIMVLQ